MAVRIQKPRSRVDLRAMDGPVPRWRNDKRFRTPDARRAIGYTLRQAFPLGGAGSFTSILEAIDEESASRV